MGYRVVNKSGVSDTQAEIEETIQDEGTIVYCIDTDKTIYFSGGIWVLFDNTQIYTKTPVPALTITTDSLHRFVTDSEKSTWSEKQDALVSGTNIKTINGNSILGYGNLSVGGGSFSGTMDDIPNGTTYVKTENNFTAALSSKLSGIEAGANNYTHPATHPPSIIVQDSSNRFVTDSEKSTWNNKANGTHSHAISDVTNLQTTLDGKADSSHSHIISDVTGLQIALDGKQVAGSYVTANTAITGATKTKVTYDSKGLVTSASDATTADIADSTNKRYVTDAQLTVIGNTSGSNTGDETTSTIKTKLGAAATGADGYLTSTDWNTFNNKQAALTNGYGLTGTTTKDVSLTTAQAFCTAETTLSAVTYADITGASISLVAGTWMIFATINGASQTTTVAVMMAAITDGANTVVVESSQHIPAGTATVRTWGSISLTAIVSPSGTTTYKLRGARGTTTQTGNWIASDGNGVNTANNVSNNSDKGTSIRAIRIA